LRHGPVAVGGLALLCTDPDGLSEDDVRLVHHVAAAAAELLWEGRVEPVQDISVERLRDAIEQRVLVAQATGVIAERFGIGTTSALAMLRTAADSSRRPLRVVAHEVVVRRRTGRLRR
ncbi:MAG: ANTAR domain-containing protein, partial [Propioniciclava sp.]